MTTLLTRALLIAGGIAGWEWAGALGALVALLAYTAAFEFVLGPLMVAALDRLRAKEGGAVATDRKAYEELHTTFARWRRRWAWYRGVDPVESAVTGSATSSSPTASGATPTSWAHGSPGITLDRHEGQQDGKRGRHLTAAPEPEEEKPDKPEPA